MRRPGDRPSAIPQHNYMLADHLPDSRRAGIPDTRRRNLFFRSSLSTSHTTLAVSETLTEYSTTLQRIRNVQVPTVTGGTITVQVTVDGSDLFEDGSRPVSGGAPSEPSTIFNFPAGAVIQTIIEATSGIPAGTANVVIETEPYRLLPRFTPVVLHGRSRLRISERRASAAANAGATLSRARGFQTSIAGRSQRAQLDSTQSVLHEVPIGHAPGYEPQPKVIGGGDQDRQDYGNGGQGTL